MHEGYGSYLFRSTNFDNLAQRLYYVKMISDTKITSLSPEWKRLRGHLMYVFGKEAKANGLSDFLEVEAARIWHRANVDIDFARAKAMDIICDFEQRPERYASRADEMSVAIAHEALYFTFCN